MRSASGWCGGSNHLIQNVSKSDQALNRYDNTRSYNSGHAWWLCVSNEIANIRARMSECENGAGTSRVDIDRSGHVDFWHRIWIACQQLLLWFRL